MAKKPIIIILLLTLASLWPLAADAGIFCPETSVSYGGEEFIEDCRQLADLNALSSFESASSRQILSLSGVDIPLRVGDVQKEFKYGWGDRLGWVDFRVFDGSLRIGGNILSGWIRIEKAGLVYLGNGKPRDGFQYANSDHLDYGVNNDGSGNLSGWGWGEKFGWINFDEATIDREGNISGRAYSNKIGVLLFSSSGPVEFAVRTDPYPWADIQDCGAIKAASGSSHQSGGEALGVGAVRDLIVSGYRGNLLNLFLSTPERLIAGSLVRRNFLTIEVVSGLLADFGNAPRGPPANVASVRRIKDDCRPSFEEGLEAEVVRYLRGWLNFEIKDIAENSIRTSWLVKINFYRTYFRPGGLLAGFFVCLI